MICFVNLPCVPALADLPILVRSPCRTLTGPTPVLSSRRPVLCLPVAVPPPQPGASVPAGSPVPAQGPGVAAGACRAAAQVEVPGCAGAEMSASDGEVRRLAMFHVRVDRYGDHIILFAGFWWPFSSELSAVIYNVLRF